MFLSKLLLRFWDNEITIAGSLCIAVMNIRFSKHQLWSSVIKNTEVAVNISVVEWW